MNKTTKTTVRFTAHDYIGSYGKAPKGRGCWAFALTAEVGGEWYPAPETIFATGTLSEAKAQAKQKALDMIQSLKVETKSIELDILG
jgi:hypothetical protein